jgi:hypothetical protein
MMATHLLEERQTARVTVRPWPAPFRAALAICNDIDCTTWPDFLALHRFLNTTGPTPFGDGLGLPVGNSFWMYSVRPDNDPGFAYFDDLDGRPSAVAPHMRELMRAGLLDVLHSYGNFSQRGGFRREHAERAAADLMRHDLRPDVWVNHGDVHNFQNIHGAGGERVSLGGREYHRGADDVPVRNVEYHLDITHRLGIGRCARPQRGIPSRHYAPSRDPLSLDGRTDAGHRPGSAAVRARAPVRNASPQAEAVASSRPAGVGPGLDVAQQDRPSRDAGQ